MTWTINNGGCSGGSCPDKLYEPTKCSYGEWTLPYNVSPANSGDGYNMDSDGVQWRTTTTVQSSVM